MRPCRCCHGGVGAIGGGGCAGFRRAGRAPGRPPAAAGRVALPRRSAAGALGQVPRRCGLPKAGRRAPRPAYGRTCPTAALRCSSTVYSCGARALSVPATLSPLLRRLSMPSGVSRPEGSEDASPAEVSPVTSVAMPPPRSSSPAAAHGGRGGEGGAWQEGEARARAAGRGPRARRWPLEAEGPCRGPPKGEAAQGLGSAGVAAGPSQRQRRGATPAASPGP
jgi:hypothetical protein